MVAHVDEVGEIGRGAADAVDHLGHPMIGAFPVVVRCRLVDEGAYVAQLLAEPGAHRGVALLRVDPQPVVVVGERQVGEDAVDRVDPVADLPDSGGELAVQAGQVVAGQFEQAVAPLGLQLVQAVGLQVGEQAVEVAVGGVRVDAEVRVRPALDECRERVVQRLLSTG